MKKHNPQQTCSVNGYPTGHMRCIYWITRSTHCTKLYQCTYKQTKKICKCSLRTRVIGDGCEVCNPKLAAEIKEDNQQEEKDNGTTTL